MKIDNRYATAAIDDANNTSGKNPFESFENASTFFNVLTQSSSELKPLSYYTKSIVPILEYMPKQIETNGNNSNLLFEDLTTNQKSEISKLFRSYYERTTPLIMELSNKIGQQLLFLNSARPRDNIKKLIDMLPYAYQQTVVRGNGDGDDNGNEAEASTKNLFINIYTMLKLHVYVRNKLVIVTESIEDGSGSDSDAP
jgi:hypothetical protein